MKLPLNQNEVSLQSILLDAMKDGEISVYDFLKLVLHHPQYGYYAQSSVIGKNGDFITSPEVSQLFGEVLALYILNDWYEKGKPQKIHLIEMGPGRGTLIIDLLNVFKKHEAFMNALSISLIEKSRDLQNKQQKHLKLWQNQNSKILHVQYCESVQEISQLGYMYCYANEFFDALPIRQYAVGQNGEKKERTVCFNDQEERFNFKDFDESYIEEDDFETLAIAQAIRDMLALEGGKGIFFDYGYVQESHISTLQTVYKHQKVGVFDHLGCADISHQVDFKALEKAFYPLKTSVVSQGDFLKEWGILLRLQKLIQMNPHKANELSMQAARLISPTMMGDHFKVLLVAG